MPGFNLVIEVLVVSSWCNAQVLFSQCHCFNLVIEVLVVSSEDRAGIGEEQQCFNLVIEVLVVSSWIGIDIGDAAIEFQSRNRGSCRFKYLKCQGVISIRQIGEFQSRNRGSCRFKP